MKQATQLIPSLLLIAGITIGMVSCTVTAHPTKRTTRTVVVKEKKAHPHGGPPGQTKKSHGHPGKKHYYQYQ